MLITQLPVTAVDGNGLPQPRCAELACIGRPDALTVVTGKFVLTLVLLDFLMPPKIPWR
jgi:hypothetical protein